MEFATTAENVTRTPTTSARRSGTPPTALPKKTKDVVHNVGEKIKDVGR